MHFIANKSTVSHRFQSKIWNCPGVIFRGDFGIGIMHRFCHNSCNLSFIIIWGYMIFVPWRNQLQLNARTLEAAPTNPTTVPEQVITLRKHARIVVRIRATGNSLRLSIRTEAPLGFLSWRVLVRIRLPVEFLLFTAIGGQVWVNFCPSLHRFTQVCSV